MTSNGKGGTHLDEVQRETLRGTAIHDKWRSSYRRDDVEPVLQVYFRRLVERLGLKPGQKILDAGCGTGFNAVRLAKMGFEIDAIDLSKYAVGQAREYAEGNGVGDRITFRQADLTKLDLADNSYDAIICFGVLMHVFELDNAVSELARILKPGGVLLIGETNRDSPVVRLRWLYWRVARRRGRSVEHLPGHTHSWLEDSGKKLFVRQVSLDWIAQQFEAKGLKRWWTNTGDFSELYASNRIAGRSFFVRLNHLWFKLGGPARLAAGFYMAFRKPDKP